MASVFFSLSAPRHCGEKPVIELGRVMSLGSFFTIQAMSAP